MTNKYINQFKATFIIKTVAQLAASSVLQMIILSSSAQAHSNGTRTYTWNPDLPTLATKTCSRARGNVRRTLKAQAKAHCKDTHDSPNNALRNTSFNKGTCTKTKTQGQRTVIRITGSSYTAQCR